MKYASEDYENYVNANEFNAFQQMIIRLAFLAGLELEKIDIWARPELDYQSMDLIRGAAMEGVPDEVLVQMAEDPEMALQIKRKYYENQYRESSQIQEVEAALSKEAVLEELRIHISTEMEKYLQKITDKIEERIGGVDKKYLGTEDAENYKAARFKIGKLIHSLKLRAPMNEEKIIQLLKNTDFTDEQAELIMEGYKKGLTYNEIMNYADPAKSKKQMEDIMQMLLRIKEDRDIYKVVKK